MAADEGARASLRRYPLIPWPYRVDAREGELALGNAAVIAGDVGRPDVRRIANELATLIERACGRRPMVAADPTPQGTIVLSLSGPSAGPGAYRLNVTPSGASVEAATESGLFYGVLTLRQLVGKSSCIPAVFIEDSPRFGWRGLHLDVSRHFFPVPFIKRYIDLLATYKLNVFHWHLTDDQGWRLEIAKHPRLTELGSMRRETIVGHARAAGPKRYYVPAQPGGAGRSDSAGRWTTTYDGTPHGGFYTQDEVREVVAYARDRYVDVLPEIEMPGHSVAALVAYPELACGPPPPDVATIWGIREEVYCPHERTFAFIEDVLGEVSDLFPFKYVHIGGDEAPKVRWKECRDAQQVMVREGLKDEEELQSWFIARAERMLEGLGRKLVGWDEILEGGLAPSATVMSWRGTSGGIAAAGQGHDVVMCPQEDMYFDHYQADPATEPLAHGGMTTLEDVYRNEPVPSELVGPERDHVLGPQGCMWTEYTPTEADVERMAYPRTLALAEIAWSEAADRDLGSFTRRLGVELGWLDRMGVRYRRP